MFYIKIPCIKRKTVCTNLFISYIERAPDGSRKRLKLNGGGSLDMCG
jgi:hypothetical protein